MKRRLVPLVALAGVLLGSGVLLPAVGSAAVGAIETPTPAATAPTPRSMVNAVPSAATPAVDNGNVKAFALSGTTMVMGGDFTSVNGLRRTYLVAFDVNTGNLLSTSFDTDGPVSALVPGPTPGTVFVGGDFTTVAGVARQDLALVDVSTGKPVSSWTPPLDNFGVVNALKLVGSRLYIAGTFTKFDNITHEGLATASSATGALDPFVSTSFTGHHNDTGAGAQGRVGVDQIDVSADGRTLVAIGDFKYAAGVLHDQVALVDLTGPQAVVRSDWGTSWYTSYCNVNAVDSYVRGVSFSPDGSYFVISAKGGFHPGTGCDAALRFETTKLSTDAQPTWRIETGGDTLWGIAVTDNAVYVGGHNKWINNPLSTKGGPGAVPRPGIMALDPLSGRPLAWNPGRDPRGVAVFVIYAVASGIYIGSNTDYIGPHHSYLRPKVAFFPYAGGAQLAVTTTQALPGHLYLGSPRAPGAPARLYSVGLDATGHSTGPLTDTGLAWPSTRRGSFLVGDQLFTGDSAANTMYQQTFTGSSLSAPVAVEPYHDPIWMNVNNGSGGTYDGVDPTLYSQYGTVTGAAYTNGRMLYTVSGKASLFSKWFSPDSGVMDQRIETLPSSVSFSTSNGIVVVGNLIYFTNRTTGNLMSAAFDGASVTGTATILGGPAVDGVDYSSTSLFLGP